MIKQNTINCLVEIELKTIWSLSKIKKRSLPKQKKTKLNNQRKKQNG
jgi:hypothetical protein